MKSRETPRARRGGVWVTKFLLTRLEKTESVLPALSSSSFLLRFFAFMRDRDFAVLPILAVVIANNFIRSYLFICYMFGVLTMV